MKKVMLFLFALLVSVEAMSQDDLANLLAGIEGYWKVEDDKVSVSAIIKNADAAALSQLPNIYASNSTMQYNGDTLTMSGKFKNVNSDVYMDYTNKVYRPLYEITVINNDTCMFVKVCVDKLISRLDYDEDNNMTNIYPINDGSRSSEAMPISSKKEERIKVNEGYIFCKVVNRMKDEIEYLAETLKGEAVFDAKEVQQNVLPTEVVIEENFEFEKVDYIDLKLDKFRRTAFAGDMMMMGGAALATIGVTQIGVDSALPTFVIVSGGLISLAGCVMHLYSYSYLKPSKVRLSPNGVTYTF